MQNWNQINPRSIDLKARKIQYYPNQLKITGRSKGIWEQREKSVKRSGFIQAKIENSINITNKIIEDNLKQILAKTVSELWAVSRSRQQQTSSCSNRTRVLRQDHAAGVPCLCEDYNPMLSSWSSTRRQSSPRAQRIWSSKDSISIIVVFIFILQLWFRILRKFVLLILILRGKIGLLKPIESKISANNYLSRIVDLTFCRKVFVWQSFQTKHELLSYLLALIQYLPSYVS